MIKEAGTSTTQFAMKLLAKSKEFGSDPGLYKMGTDFFSSPPSNVMKRLPGFSVGLSAFGGSLIDTTQFSWRFGVRLVLRLLSARTDMSMAPIMWQVLSDSMDDYDTFLVKPGFRACSGLGVMMGYSNPWARLFRESCNSAVATQATAVETVRVLFVGIPTLACICKESQGLNFATYIRDNCWEAAPSFMKPVIAKLVMQSESSSMAHQAVCKSFGESTEDSLRSIMDPVMQHAYAATEAVGSSLDYLTILIDPEAGSCSNLISSPYTMAIVPEPIDYFRACGKTHTCRSKCATVFEEFDAVRERLSAGSKQFEFRGTVEKSFFSGLDVSEGKSVAPFEILAMMEVNASDLCTTMEQPLPCCGSGDARDRCVIICGLNDISELQVVEYCVPYNVGIGTHERTRWSIVVDDPSEIRSVHFGTRTELVVSTVASVVLFGYMEPSRVLMEALPDSATYSAANARMHRVAWVFVSPGKFGIIHGFINTPEQAVSTRTSVCIDMNDDRWARRPPISCQTNLNLHLDGHIPTCVGENRDNLLLLPTRRDASVRYCARKSQFLYEYTCVESAPMPTLSRDLGYGDASSASFFVTTSLNTVRRTPILSINTLFPGNTSVGIPARIFNANPTAISSTWLEEVRILWDQKEASKLLNAYKKGSQQIDSSIAIQQRCAADDCSGCTAPAVQRACFAVQQCAVAKCIGTVVNLERPLCSVGRLLQAGLDVDLAKMHGIWTVLTDMMSFVLQAATGMTHEGTLELEFIDDIFFSLVCEAKHGIIASMSIITSLINGIINSSDRARRSQTRGYIPQQEDQEAENAEAVRTMTAAATTNFLSQISLGVLYPVIVAKKTIMCHTDAFLGIFEQSGFRLKLSSSNYAAATNSLVGQCLSEYHTESMQSPSSDESKKSMMSVMQSIAVDAGTAVAQIPFERALHSLDGAFSYALGIVSGLTDVIATADQQHCNLPDTEARDIALCSCGDTPVEIPNHRAIEGITHGAFWCSGMLSLISSMGETYLGYNPYSYKDIMTALHDNSQTGKGFDKYLICISTTADRSCLDLLPTLPKLEIQGISLITVITRCKSNYANSQWDDGAAAIFSDMAMKKFIINSADLLDDAYSMQNSMYNALPDSLISCMKLALQENRGNDACLADWLTLKNTRRQLYFQYLPIVQTVYGSEIIAACQVFTGPASEGRIDFTRCLDDPDGEQGGCELGGMLWAGRSANRVPVASPHALVQNNMEERYTAANNAHRTTRKFVENLISSKEIQEWDAAHLDLAIFTADGDALHQLFDALVLGPYARANVWPMDLEQKLTRVDWFRDKYDGTTREFQLPCSGDALRNVTSSPFTCGSATRRSVIRYFMRDVFAASKDDELQKAVQLAVKEMMDNLFEQWSSASYGCLCDDQSSKVECCDPDDPDTFLPLTLQNVKYTTLSGNTLVQGLFNSIGTYVEKTLWTRGSKPFTQYNLDMKDPMPIPADWINKVDSTWNAEEKVLAAEYGMFRTDIPLLSYNEKEVAEPFGGLTMNVSLWRMCHGLLQQTHSTLPMGPDHLPVGVFTDLPPEATAFSGDTTVRQLELVVHTITRNAWEVSPLHYSHVMRHLPSDSLLCESAYEGVHAYNPDETPSARVIIPDSIDNMDVLNYMSKVPDISNINPHAGGLGAARFACLCGWTHAAQGCYLPESVCTGSVKWETVNVLVSSYCRSKSIVVDNITAYAIPRPGNSKDGDVVRDAVTAAWRDEWVCSSFAPSESWGVLNRTSMEQWLLGRPLDQSPVSMRELLQHGRGGLRVGTMESIIREKGWKRGIHPAKQIKPLYGPANSTMGQKWCTKNSAEMLPASFADRFIDELFPIAQGVLENTGLAVCLRVIVEAARLRVLLLLAGGMSGDAYDLLLEAIQNQEATLGQWRRRCRQQVDTFGMCTLRGVFNVPPVLEEDQSDKCPFNLIRTADERSGVWLTPGCLIHHQAYIPATLQKEEFSTGPVSYFNPCRCMSCAGDVKTVVYISNLMANPACKVAFDPHIFAKKYKHSSSLFWALDYTDETDIVKKENLKKTVEILHTERMREDTGMAIDLILDTYVRNESPATDSSAFGNAPADKQWFEAEGSDGTLHCDLINDWWPEQWQQPVGLHVTTPCHSSETAYRGFDSQFTVDRSDLMNPKMLYQHESLRDPILSRNDFGRSGVCRMRNVGMPAQEINTMRFCTRTPTSTSADPAVHLKPMPADIHVAVESCASSNRGVPWDAVKSPVLNTYGKSAGVVLSWPGTDTNGIWTWPLSHTSAPLSAPKDVTNSKWGRDGCGLPPLFTCKSDADCTRQIGSFQSDLRYKCMGSEMSDTTTGSDETGVCMMYTPNICVKHMDCHNGEMCSGDGVCVEPVVSFYNNRSEEIEIHMFAQSCAPLDRKDTYGHSPWEQVPDILRSHGLCSHRKWFEYRELMQNPTPGLCSVKDSDVFNQGICTLDTQGGNFWRYTKSYNNQPVAAVPLQANDILAMEAHACDRDFMHLEGYSECQPNGLAIMRNMNNPVSSEVQPSAYNRGRSFATYTTPENSTIPYARLPFFDNAQLGFLGTQLPLYEIVDDEISDKAVLQSCADIAHCSVQPWTVRGTKVSPRQTPLGRAYTLTDALQCGPFGFQKENVLAANRCTLDSSVIPMYRILCQTPESEFSGSCKKNRQMNIPEICRSLVLADQNGYTTSEVVVRNIKTNINYLAQNGFLAWSSPQTFSEYFQQTECARWVLEKMQVTPSPVLYKQITGEDESDTTPLPDMMSVGFYHFRTFSFYEVSPLWWVKCILFSTDVVFGDSESACPVWGLSTQENEPPHRWLARRVGVVNSTTVEQQRQATKERISYQALQFEEVFGQFMDNNFPGQRSVCPGKLAGSKLCYDFNPVCSAGLSLDQASLDKEKADELTETATSRVALPMLNHIRNLVRANTLFFEAATIKMDDWESCRQGQNQKCTIANGPKTFLTEIKVPRFEKSDYDILQIFLKTIANDCTISEIDIPTRTRLDQIEFFDVQCLGHLDSSDHLSRRDMRNVFASRGVCTFDADSDDKGKQTCLFKSMEEELASNMGFARNDDSYNPNPLTVIFSKKPIAGDDGKFLTQWGQTDDLVAFNLCPQSYENEEGDASVLCGLHGRPQPVRQTPQTPTVWHSEDWRADWVRWTNEHAKSSGRCFSANERCLSRDVQTERDTDSGHMMTHVKDHRVSKFTWMRVPKNVHVDVIYTPTTLLMEGVNPPYENTWNGPFGGRFNAGDAEEEKYHMYGQEKCQTDRFATVGVVNCLFAAWRTLWDLSKKSVQQLRSQIPRYLSDAFEENPRGGREDDATDQENRLIGKFDTREPVMHLYKNEVDIPAPTGLIRGLDSILSSGNWIKSLFHAFPGSRFEEETLPKVVIRTGGGRGRPSVVVSTNYPSNYYTRSPIGQTGLPYAQFESLQMAGSSYDPAYPTALFVSGKHVYVSTSGLRQFIEKKLNDLFSKNSDPDSDSDAFQFQMESWVENTFSCTGCLQVIHREHPRYETDPPVLEPSVPDWAHCIEAGKMRTLQDIVIDNVLHLSVADLKRELTSMSLPIFFVRWRDLTSGAHDAFNGNSDTKNGRALALKHSIHAANKKKNLRWIRETTNADTKSFPFISRDSRNDAAIIETTYFIHQYIEEYPMEARLLYVAQRWPWYSKKFFEVYKHPIQKIQKQAGKHPLDKEGIIGYNIQLDDQMFCHPTQGQQTLSDEEGLFVCGEGKVANVVGPNLVKCKPCSSAREHLCNGPIACESAPWLSVLRNAADPVIQDTDDNSASSRQNDLRDSLKKRIGFARELTLDASVDVMLNIVKDMIVKWDTDLILDRYGNGVSGYISIPFKAENLDLFDNAFSQYPLDWDAFKGYNPISSMRYEETTGLKGPDGQIIPFACVDAVETNDVDYTKCNQHEGMIHLNKTFIESFTRERGVLVRNGYRGTWTVTRDQLTRDGAIPFWADSTRSKRDRFATWLLDYTEHCLSADRWNSVCMQTQGSQFINLFNPWLGGDYSPVDKCDSTFQESNKAYIIDTLCPKEICADADERQRSMFGKSQYVNKDGVSSCVFRNGKPSVSRVVGADDPTNLCSKIPKKNENCLHPQGTLAGPGSMASSVYAYSGNAEDVLSYNSFSTGTKSVDGAGGLFVEPQHSVFRGTHRSTTSGKAGIVRVSPYDIAGHNVRYIVDVDGLKVTDVLLGSHLTMQGSDQLEGGGTRWLEQIKVRQDSASAAPSINPREDWTDWACPLRQQQFLQGHVNNFRVQYPDLRRAQILFAKANGGKQVHPTQASNESAVTANTLYHSANGVCACNGGTDICRQVVNLGMSDGAMAGCGFSDTVRSLFDQKWRTSTVVEAETCTDQMDWPFTGGLLRDKFEMSRYDSDGVDIRSDGTCATLSRLPRYEYRYIPTPLAVAPSGWSNTLDDGGDCHTGRITTHAPALTSECRLMSRSHTSTKFGCPSEADPANLEEITLPRMVTETPPVVMQKSQNVRRRCQECSAPPTFHTSDGTPLPVSESSTTTPFRVSTARKIASEIRDKLSLVLCGSLDGCQRMEKTIDRAQWVPERFWNNFIYDVDALIHRNQTNENSTATSMDDIATIVEGSTPKKDEYEDDLELWARPWLYCTPAEIECVDECDIVTGDCKEVCAERDTSKLTCQGTMHRDDWMDPKKRRMTTIKAFEAAVLLTDDDEASKPMNVCDLDKTLSLFCKNMQAARSLVFDANCQASGVCFKESFFYQPSMFSMSNNQFVRQTVEQFYRGVDKEACEAQVTARKAKIREQNAELVPKCPATFLELFSKVLRTARMQAGAIVRASYFMTMLILHACRLMIPGSNADMDDAIQSMLTNLNLMFMELGAAMGAMLNLLMETLLGSSIGEWLESVVVAICQLVNWLMSIFYLGIFCPIKLALEGVITDIINAFAPIGISLPGLVTFRALMQAMSCDPNDVLAQCIRAADTGVKPLAKIPAATRCWSTYVNTLGDSASLSCSAADTCAQFDRGDPNDPTNMVDEKGNVACDDCPILSGLPDFQRYGCDIVRKQCKCAVQTNTHTPCINHAQCQSSGSTCDILDTAFTSSSFGTQPCDTCAAGKPMCIAAVGGARCACPIREEGFQTCAIDSVSETIMPDPLSLCLVTLSSATTLSAQHSSEYALSYDDLAAAPCSITTNTYCYTVYKSSWQAASFVVGLGTLNIGRRLLDDEGLTFESMEATLAGLVHIAPHDLERVAARPWNDVLDEGCRLVGPLGSLTKTTNLSISDQILYKQCVRWRAIGDDVQRTFNLTVPDTFLLSFQDLASVLRDPIVFATFVSRPYVMFYTMLHSEAAAPVRSVMRSLKMWSVHTMTYIVEKTRWANTTEPIITNINTSSHHVSRNANHIHTAHGLRLELMRAAPMLTVPLTSEVEVNTDKELDSSADILEEMEDFLDDSNILTENDDVFTGVTPETFNETSFLYTQPLVVSDEEYNSTANNRRLLTFQSQLDAVKKYTAQLALQDGAKVLIGGNLRDAFATGPISFTGTYANFDIESGCEPAWNLWTLLARTSNILTVYFMNTNTLRPPVERDILLTLPSFSVNKTAKQVHPLQMPLKSFAGDAGRFIFQTIAGFDATYFLQLMDAFPNLVRKFAKCDVNSVMQCSEFRFSFISSAVSVAVVLFTIALTLSSIGVPYAWTFIGLVYLPIVMFYSMGYSPFCAPMLPTCLGQEIIAALDGLIPVKISWPAALQAVPNCIENTNIPANECIVSCNAHPFSFRGWSEPIAWSICEISPSVCQDTYLWMREQSFAKDEGSTLFDLSTAFGRYSTIKTQNDPEQIVAYRVCAIFTAWRSVPVLLLCGFSIYILPLLVILPIQFLLASTQIIFASVFMSHLHIRDD